MKMFPIQARRGGRLGYISWDMAEKAYEVYSFLYGTDQSLERLAERGGFGLTELCYLLEGEYLDKAKKRGFKWK